MPTRRTAHASHAMGSVRSMTVPVHVVYTGVGYRYQVTSKELASLLYSKSSLRGECIFILARSHFECENLNEEARILTFGLLRNGAASREQRAAEEGRVPSTSLSPGRPESSPSLSSVSLGQRCHEDVLHNVTHRDVGTRGLGLELGSNLLGNADLLLARTRRLSRWTLGGRVQPVCCRRWV